MERSEIVVVTGASRGIGSATVEALVREHGKKVVAISRDHRGLHRLIEMHPGEVEALQMDISTEDAPIRIKEHVAGRRVRALVHNAGLLHSKPMGEHAARDLQHLFNVNVVAPLLITQALLDVLDGDPAGHIVHIGSMGGFQDSVKFPGLVAYSASKAALACQAQCLAEEFSSRSIRSNCLALGSVDTEMLRAAFPGYKAAMAAVEMGSFIARFALEGHHLFNGKVLPVATSTP